MIVFVIIGSLAAIGALCWLLFMLAVFALPAFIGVSAGIWAHETGAGLVCAIVIGAAAAGVALGVGQRSPTAANRKSAAMSSISLPSRSREWAS
jgi:hypothetical protein